MPHLLISAAHKSSGKTTLAVGLCAALRQRGRRVQAFKKGPDYIDPLWLAEAAGRACYNLDFYTMESEEIRARFAHRSRDSDIALVEGNKGLYDGLSLDGSNSNAALAKLLDAPVVLVLDARGMTRGIAPLILGYEAFDSQIRIAGVILNKLGGRRHESKLRAVIEHYTDVPVVGAVQYEPDLEIVERHLGLVPQNEVGQARKQVDSIAQHVSQQVDLDRIEAIAATATPVVAGPIPDTSVGTGPEVTIAVARDAAFGFYYPDDLEAMERAGARVVFFDTLRDTRLPAADALFIGGGFPETHIPQLQANASLRQAIRQFVDDGGPVYAECGGLMYLCRSLCWRDQRGEMVGALPADVVMQQRPAGRGYVRLAETADAPWPRIPGQGTEIPAHEFHYSTLQNLDPGVRFAYEVRRGSGIDGSHDGIVYKNVLASYAHLHHVARYPWTARFVQWVRQLSDHRSHRATGDV